MALYRMACTDYNGRILERAEFEASGYVNARETIDDNWHTWRNKHKECYIFSYRVTEETLEQEAKYRRKNYRLGA